MVHVSPLTVESKALIAGCITSTRPQAVVLMCEYVTLDGCAGANTNAKSEDIRQDRAEERKDAK